MDKFGRPNNQAMETMQIKISNLHDFFTAVQPAYDRLKTTAQKGVPTIEVVLLPGKYEGLHLILDRSMNENPVNIILRGDDPGNPPLLSNLTINFSGMDIQLENLIFHDIESASPLISLEVLERISLKKCAFVSNCSTSASGGELVQFSSTSSSAVAEVRDCWFIRNRTANHDPILGFYSGLPNRFKQVHLENTMFLDNEAEFIIVPQTTQTINMERCIHYPNAVNKQPQVLVAINNPESVLTIGNSLMVGDELRNIITHHPLLSGQDNSFRPLTINDSTLFLDNPATINSTPVQAILNNTIVQPATRIRPTKEMILSLDRFIEDAMGGHTPDFASIGGEIMPPAQ